jgi:hypothetical protein
MEQSDEKDVVPESMNSAVAEKAKEAVLLAMTILGMSRTDVVDTYNHLARQNDVAVGTELDSSKVWLKFYRGVHSALEFDTGLERVDTKNEHGEITRKPRERLADDATLSIVKEHSDPEKLKQAGRTRAAAKRIEKHGNDGVTGYSNDQWESAFGEIVANVAIAGCTPKEAIDATRLAHNDMKEVGMFVPESYLSSDSGEAIDLVGTATR